MPYGDPILISRQELPSYVSTPQQRAHKRVGNALRDGRMKKEPCCVCGDPKAEAHHDDYSKPLEVRWLCRIHHLAFHRLLKRKRP